MVHETEASCLLRTGRLYTRRIGLRTAAGGLVFAGTKQGAFSLYFDDEPIAHFDLEGRWQRVFRNGTHYRKALDGSIDAIDRVREGPNLVLRRRPLSFAEGADLDDDVRAAALGLLSELARDALGVIPPPEPVPPLDLPRLVGLLERVARWDAAAWFRHREQYRATYGPLPFLPPDAHQSVILQAEPVAGVSFEDHLHAVAALLGRRAAQCRSVFLTGETLPRQPIDALADAFDAIGPVFPLSATRPARRGEWGEEEVRLAGIDLYLTDFRPPLPCRAGWERLAARHLGRVNLELPSGDPQLRRESAADWSNEDLRALVATLKEAGVAVGLIVLGGTGGPERAELHENATCALITSLHLNRGDLITLVDATERADAPLPPRGWVAPQLDRLKDSLSAFRQRTGAKVVVYSRDKEWN